MPEFNRLVFEINWPLPVLAAKHEDQYLQDQLGLVLQNQDLIFYLVSPWAITSKGICLWKKFMFSLVVFKNDVLYYLLYCKQHVKRDLSSSSRSAFCLLGDLWQGLSPLCALLSPSLK